MYITLGTQSVRRGRGKLCTMVKELLYLGACTVWWILNSSFWTPFIFICSMNHEQWCDDCSLLNMYFNKYINYIYGFFKKKNTSEFQNTCTLVFITTKCIHVHVKFINIFQFVWNHYMIVKQWKEHQVHMTCTELVNYCQEHSVICLGVFYWTLNSAYMHTRLKIVSVVSLKFIRNQNLLILAWTCFMLLILE